MDQISVELKPEIKTYDIDIAGHLSNFVYIRWLEDLRTKLFNNYLNLQDLLSDNLYPVVTSTSISYKTALKLFDKPASIMNLHCYKHDIITLKVEIKLGEKIAAFGEQKCVLMDLNTVK